MGEHIQEPDREIEAEPTRDPRGLSEDLAIRKGKLEKDREVIIGLGLSSDQADEWQKYEVDMLNADIDAENSLVNDEGTLQ